MSTFVMPVERGKIREFATVAQTNDPAYRRDDAVVTPTFLTTARLVWDPDIAQLGEVLGFDLGRILHAEEEYVFHGRLPRAGESLTVSMSVVDRFEKQGKRGGTMRFAVLVNEFRDTSGVVVAEQRSTIVETGQAPVQS